MAESKSNPVVISGLGVIAPQALGSSEFLEKILCPEVIHGSASRFDSTGFTCSEVGELKKFAPLDYVKKKKKLKLMGENITYAVGAAALAAENAALTPEACSPERLGVIIGSRTRISDFPELEKCVCSSLAEDGTLDFKLYGEEGMHHVYPLSMLRNLPNMASAHVSIMHDALGPTDSITNGATSAIQSVGEALRTIERGAADIMIAGGTDSLVSPLDFSQLASLDVLLKESGQPFRSFDKQSNGGFPGEGSAVFILERLDHCIRRGAIPLVYLESFAEGFEPAFAYENPQTMSDAWSRAISAAGYGVKDIKAVSLVGSGFKSWEKVEASLYEKTFGDSAPLAWSSRAHSGLAGAAISAFDLAGSILSVMKDIVPVTSNCFETADYMRNVNLVTGEHAKNVAGPRLVTSHNRAGATAVLVIRPVE